MRWFRQTLRRSRLFLLGFLLVETFYLLDAQQLVHAYQVDQQSKEIALRSYAETFGIPIEKLRGDERSLIDSVGRFLSEEAGPLVSSGVSEIEALVRDLARQVEASLSPADVRLAAASPQEPVAGPKEAARSAFEEKRQDRRLPLVASADKEQTRPALRPEKAKPLPLRRVEKQVRTQEGSAVDLRQISSAVAPESQPRRVIPKDAVAAEIVALAQSLGDSPGRIFRFVHDEIDFDPKWGAAKSPLGTLHERRGTSWEQAWLLQQLLTAAGVDARLEWGEVEIPTAKLINLIGVADAFRAGDLLTTAGVPIVLIVDGSQVVGARMSHVWVKAFLDYIPNRGATPGPGDKWIRMDPSLKRFDVGAGVRLDEDVPFDLGEYLQSGTLLSPRAYYEDALAAYADAHNLGGTGLEELKPAKSLIQEAFPFVPGSLRAKILSVAGEATDVPAAFQQQLELQVREAGGPVLLSWSTPWPAVYGKRLDLAWPGATSADQAALDLHGGVFATPPYEVDLRPVLRVDRMQVTSGEEVGSAEDIEILVTLTPPQGSPTVAFFELFAGEHAVFTVDFGRIAQETVDRNTAERDAATDADEEEAWALALAAAVYLRSLSGDLEHLSALRYRRLVQIGNVVLAVQRGAVSRSPDGTPLTFSAAPPSLDLGAMVLGLFPADGVAGPTSTSVSTVELLGSQSSAREGESLAQALGGEHLTAVGFLTRAAREGQTLTRVDATNLEPALAAAELSSNAEASVRAGVDRGLIAWISETQLPFDTWDATGYVLEDPATGAGGYFVTFERLVQGLEANIVFHSPQDLAVVTAPIDVVATLEGEAIDRWTLANRAADGGPAVELASGTGSFANATLARFDPTLLLNGLYDLVLTARDAAGQTASRKISAVVEGNMKIGHFTLSFVDLAIPLSGLDIEIVRTYDSRRRSIRGDFGYGWTLDIRQGSYRNNRPPGDGWQILPGSGPFGLPCSSTQESKRHLTTIRLSDQEIYQFRLVLQSPATVFGGCFADAAFELVDAPRPGATLDILGDTRVFYADGSDRVVIADTQETFVPEDVKLTTRDGRIFHLNLAEGVTHLEDPNGNRLDITNEGISHSSGQGMDFECDADGHITRIVDPLGNANVYTYDVGGDLVAFTDRAVSVTRFTYAAGHYLEETENALGVRAVRVEYDDEGRMVRMIDGDGRPLTFEHDIGGRREVFTNRLGQVRVMEYDERGNLVREVAGDGSVTLRTFDAKDRLLSETDPLGNTSTNSYNAAGDLMETIDPLGNTIRFTYDGRGNAVTVTDARGGVTTFVYDAQNNPVSITDALGGVLSMTYDSRGLRLSVTDALGNTRSTAYDAAGQPMTVVDPLGVTTTTTYDSIGNPIARTRQQTLSDGSLRDLVTTYTFDALGRVVTSTDPSGAVTSSTFDALGSVLTTTDALGRVTSMAYDTRGLHASTTYADGTRDVFGYDDEGRLSTVTDRAGWTTTFVYDVSGQLIETRYPDGTSRRSAYDAAGRRISDTDTQGRTTSYAYDAAGRQTSTTDPLGHSTVTAYDAGGNVASITDALGNTATFVYDAAGRRVQTNLPDGTQTRTEYDLLNRAVAEIDAAGVRTELSYDDAGRLTEVLDALGGRTRYRYDEQGNRIEQIDANGRSTRSELDPVGRQIRRELPGGAAESFAYNLAGNLVAHTDPSGATTTFAYDSIDRLVERTDPAGTSVRFTYTASGQRATMTDGRGITVYAYDNRDRLTSMTYPDGWSLHNQWDSEGRRTALMLDLGDPASGGLGLFTTAYARDALGRLTGVTDAGGGVSTTTYDALGREVSLTQPNGVTTSRSYSANGHLIGLETTAPDGAVIQSYDHTLGPTGHRQSVLEADGTRRSWTYDILYRLTAERVTDSADALLFEHRFSYDAVGNRLTQERLDGAGSVELITSQYDERDRLLSETHSGTTTTYAWDIDGNLVSRVGSAGTTTYGWNVESRLVSATLPDGSKVANIYDGDGVWVGRTVQRAGEPPQSRTLLADTTEVLSQLLAEVEGGALTAHYARGERLLAIFVDGAAHTVHPDGLGSIRALTDASGALTDRYGYEAFGNLVDRSGTSANPFGFAGEYFDSELALAHHRARWMNPSLGVFLSRDPWPSSPRRPATLHRYLYAEANPVNRVDPSGHFGVSAIGLRVGLAIVGLAATIGFIYWANIPARTDWTIPVRLRPIVATGSRWTDAEVHFKLSETRSILGRRATLALTWGPIERKSSINPLMNLGTAEEFTQLLEPLSKQNQGVPIVFIASFYNPMSVLGLGGGDGLGATWRGVVMDQDAVNNPYTLSHELGHAIGFLSHQVLPGVPGPSVWQPFELFEPVTGCPLGSPFLMAPGGICAIRGTQLVDSERQQLRIHAFSLR